MLGNPYSSILSPFFSHYWYYFVNLFIHPVREENRQVLSDEGDGGELDLLLR